jgi:hypothetical protein
MKAHSRWRTGTLSLAADRSRGGAVLVGVGLSLPQGACGRYLTVLLPWPLLQVELKILTVHLVLSTKQSLQGPILACITWMPKIDHFIPLAHVTSVLFGHFHPMMRSERLGVSCCHCNCHLEFMKRSASPLITVIKTQINDAYVPPPALKNHR